MEDIGTHSIISAAAMSMFLENVTIFLIMLEVIWYLDKLLKYTRKQFMELSKGSSPRMINNDPFHTLRDMRSSLLDPRTGNNEPFATQLSTTNASDMRSEIQT